MAARKNTVSDVRSLMYFSAIIVMLTIFAIIARTGNNGKTSVLVAQEADDSANQRRHLSEQENYIKNLRREVNDIKKVVKTLDTSAIDALINDFEKCNSTLAGQVGTQDFWNTNGDCSYFSRDAEDMLNDVLRPQRTCADNKRSIDDRRREKGNLDRQVKDILRNDKSADLSAYRLVETQINDMFKKADGAGVCNSETVDIFMDVQNELNSLFQDAYSNLGDLQQKSNDVQRLRNGTTDLKNMTSQCKNLAREFKNFGRDMARVQRSAGGVPEESRQAYQTVELNYKGMCDPVEGALIKMQKALESKDVDGFDDYRNEFQGYEQEVWTLMNEARNLMNEKEQIVHEKKQYEENMKNVTRDLKQREKELGSMKKRVAKLKKQYDRSSKKFIETEERQVALKEFGAFITEFDTVTNTLSEAIATAESEAQEDPDAYWYDRNEEINEMQQQFYELQQKAEMIMNVMKMLANGTKELKNVEKQWAGIKADPRLQEINTEINELLSSAREDFSQAWTLVVSDPEEAQSIVESIFELAEDLGERVDEILGEEEEF